MNESENNTCLPNSESVTEQDMNIRTGSQLKNFRLKLPRKFRSQERFASFLINPRTNESFSGKWISEVEKSNKVMTEDLLTALKNFRKVNKL